MVGTRKDIFSYLFITLLIMSTFIIRINATSASFSLIKYTYKSSADTQFIYPGSKNVELTVEVKYVGTNNITSISGCIKLPNGFTISKGKQACSPPYTTNETTYTIVHPGDVVIFKYSIDVSKDVLPGYYNTSIVINYRNVNEVQLREEVLDNITLYISEYPHTTAVIVDYYWTPNAYPGSEGVSMNIVIENKGNSTIVSGHGILTLPKIIEPSRNEFDVGNLGELERTTITISGLNISPDANSSLVYIGNLKMNVTSRTDDGVTYLDSINTTFNFKISNPPYVKIKVISYSLKPYFSSTLIKEGDIYVTLQNMDTATLSSVTATFEIVYGGYFIGKKYTSTVTVNGPFRYGDYIHIKSEDVIINNGSNSLTINLKLDIFGSEDNAEFWTTEYHTFVIKAENQLANKGLWLVTSGWENNYPVYPKTQNATLVITLTNEWPYQISGLKLKLILPSGFFSNSLENRRISQTYIPGPINSLNTVTASFTITVGNVSSGIYNGTLVAEYVLNQESLKILQKV